MIAIRPEQFETLERKAHRDFEDELVAHLRGYSPRHASGVGEAGLRELIQSGLKRARGHGFRLRGSLRFFVECQVMFGHEFDADPLIPWAAREWGRKGWRAELERADAIHEIAMEYRRAVAGEKDEIEAAAIRRLVGRPVKELLEGDPGEMATRQMLADVHPEKFERAPAEAVLGLLDRGNRAAALHGLPAAPGGRAMAALMFAFGRGAATDPQFPWIAANLHETREQAPGARAEKLAVRAVAYLSDALKELERE